MTDDLIKPRVAFAIFTSFCTGTLVNLNSQFATDWAVHNRDATMCGATWGQWRLVIPYTVSQLQKTIFLFS